MLDSNNGSAHLFRFDAFELDRHALELRKEGVKVKLEGQPLRILGMLVERPGELVTREDLRRELWPGNTIVHFEHSITAAMKRLREALGDSPETPRYIETLPRRGYRFKASACGLRERFLDRGPARLALAVLPLRNLSGDAGQDYYADGLSEALITELGKIGRLQVLSFQSVSRYRQTQKGLPEIARELGVDVLLEGSVMRSGDRVRITAKLFQAAPERPVLSESYEFEARDVLAVQAEVARDVAARTRITLTPQEQARLSSARMVDPQAYEAYLLGQAFFLNYAPGTPQKAKAYYEKAIARDPSYAPAYAGLAQLLAGRPFVFPEAVRVRARELAERALALDDSLVDAHTALAKISQQEWDWAGAERAFRRAIEINPSYALTRVWYATYLFGTERFDEASEQAEHAQRVDPVSSYVNTLAGMAYFLAGRVDQARATWQRIIDLDPMHSLTSRYMAESYLKEGNYDRTIAILEKQLTYTPKDNFVLGALAHSYARAGRRKEALRLTKDLVRGEASGDVQSPVPVMWAYAGLQEYDQAFARLEEAATERRDRMIWLRVDPWLEPLHSDPRFRELVRRMNLPSKSTVVIRKSG